MKIGFIGLGKLGAPCATAMHEAGHAVIGYDVNPIPNLPFPTVSSIVDLVVQERPEFIFIAVPTPHDPKYGGDTPSSNLPSMGFEIIIVWNVICEIYKHVSPEQTVVLISTVLPGTVRKRLMSPYSGNPKAEFIYNPYLIAMGTVAEDMVNPEMVIIGSKTGDHTPGVKKLIRFYRSMMQNNPRYEVGTWDDAECIKVFYNTFISAKIGLVNMIQDVAERSGNIDAKFVSSALAKSTVRITGPAYMKPGMGDAGACHPRDNIALSSLAHDLNLGYDLFKAIMQAREQQARSVAERLHDLSHRIDPATFERKTPLQIYIHGESYKPGVPYTDGSYSHLIEHYLWENYKVRARYIDPMLSLPKSVKGVVLMAHHAPTTYSHSTSLMKGPQPFYCEIEPGSVVLDMWGYLKDTDVPGSELYHYGSTRGRSGYLRNSYPIVR